MGCIKIVIYENYRIEHTHEKCHSIHIDLSKHRNLFFRERNHLSLFLNYSKVIFSSFQKHLGLELNCKLNEKNHEENKGASLLCKLQPKKT